MYTEVGVQHVCTAKTHLVPEGLLSLDPPLGALELSPAVHYWLRSIKGGQFRLVNFASHFIRVQIFQIYFPLILYL